MTCVPWVVCCHRLFYHWVYSLALCVHCLFQLSENQIADRDILTVFAEDKDGGLDGTVSYSISGKMEMVNDTRKRLISTFVIHLFYKNYIKTCYKRNFTTLASLCS